MTDPDSQQDAHSLLGQVIADRYAVEELLGEGAMGRVYRARHVHMQKLVALKVLHRTTSERPEVVSRFEREAVAAGRIDHPNVASATDFGRLADGNFYLVLEFVEGESLGALLSGGALPVERAVSIARQIALALAAAHAAGIVHRDLKPENVMLVLTSDTPTLPTDTRFGEAMASDQRVKVLDFGLAKLNQSDPSDTQLTMVGAVYGTPQYMSPEQAEGQSVDQRADLYALGLILYEMLAGHPPFQADQTMALLIKQMTAVPPALPLDIPKPLSALVMRLLEKAPEDRLQSAEAVLDALDEIAQSWAAGSRRGTQLTIPSGREILQGAKRFSAEVAERCSPLTEHLKSDEFKRKLRFGALKERLPLEAVSRQLRGDLQIRGHAIPRVLVAGGAVALLFGALLVWALSGGSAESESGGTTPPPLTADAAEERAAEQEEQRRDEVLDPELKKLIDAARRGSDTAASALELRDDSDRGASEWLALCHVRLLRKKVEPALAAYQQAIKLDPSVVSDRAVVGMLRYLADDERYAEPILEFVTEHLGQRAPDFLFSVWSGTSLKTPATTLAWKLLDSSAMRSASSESLKVALDLRDKQNCAERLPLLSRVADVGDERSMLLLREMKKDKDCAKRAGEALDRALLQAGQTKAPQFPLLRRVRFLE